MPWARAFWRIEDEVFIVKMDLNFPQKYGKTSFRTRVKKEVFLFLYEIFLFFIHFAVILSEALSS